jgi:hypothetical protein
VAVIRSTMIFAAGVAVGAAGREALPKLKETLGPLVKEKWAPLAAAAVAGAREAVTDACADVARNVGERIETVQDRVAERQGTASPPV